MSNSRRKIGRNEPCPCGSGKKYKRCHGSVTASAAFPFEDPSFLEALQQKREEFEATEQRRRQQQGLGRPIISTVCKGYRIVFVGDGVYSSKSWRTFHDFLRDYFFSLMGHEWLTEQRRLWTRQEVNYCLR